MGIDILNYISLIVFKIILIQIFCSNKIEIEHKKQTTQ